MGTGNGPPLRSLVKIADAPTLPSDPTVTTADSPMDEAPLPTAHPSGVRMTSAKRALNSMSVLVAVRLRTARDTAWQTVPTPVSSEQSVIAPRAWVVRELT